MKAGSDFQCDTDRVIKYLTDMNVLFNLKLGLPNESSGSPVA